MKFIFSVLLLFVCGCAFRPLYSSTQVRDVCVLSVPSEEGYLLTQTLKNYFPQQTNCTYTLKAQRPTTSFTNQSISGSDFTTNRRITTQTSYELLDSNKKSVLKNSVSAVGSSSLVNNPYSSVIAEEKTQHNLYTILAEQMALHISAFLNRTSE